LSEIHKFYLYSNFIIKCGKNQDEKSAEMLLDSCLRRNDGETRMREMDCGFLCQAQDKLARDDKIQIPLVPLYQGGNAF